LEIGFGDGKLQIEKPNMHYLAAKMEMSEGITDKKIPHSRSMTKKKSSIIQTGGRLGPNLSPRILSIPKLQSTKQINSLKSNLKPKVLLEE
jgi:hypothetical protein